MQIVFKCWSFAPRVYRFCSPKRNKDRNSSLYSESLFYRILSGARVAPQHCPILHDRQEAIFISEKINKLITLSTQSNIIANSKNYFSINTLFFKLCTKNKCISHNGVNNPWNSLRITSYSFYCGLINYRG